MRRRWAERIIAVELKRHAWTDTELWARRQSDPAQLALAAPSRWETTLAMGWLAKRLAAGTRKSAAMMLHRWGEESGATDLRQPKAMV